eukprot:scaffold11150_cov203-Skeletonema_marinoi.AAC.3
MQGTHIIEAEHTGSKIASLRPHGRAAPGFHSPQSQRPQSCARLEGNEKNLPSFCSCVAGESGRVLIPTWRFGANGVPKVWDDDDFSVSESSVVC